MGNKLIKRIIKINQFIVPNSYCKDKYTKSIPDHLQSNLKAVIAIQYY